MISIFKKYEALSKSAKTRVAWFDYHRKCQNVSLTCRHFGISRKTFYKWKSVYNPKNLYSLEDRSKTPRRVRQPEILPYQEERIVKLRKEYLCYGKIKLAKIYEIRYQEHISSWKVQRIIQKYKIYHQPKKIAKMTKRRLNGLKQKRITELTKKPKSGFLICLDSIEIRCQNLKRFIFTAIDYYSKIAFARIYKNDNSYNATDFLNRLLFLINGKVENIQTDNGSEFKKTFNLACQKFKLTRYLNRPRTPKDNSINERFNRTLQDEFIKLGNFNPEPEIFNKRLTNWLIEYNFKRPHETLNYQTPMKFAAKVSPMYPSGTMY
jgi:transposase InsO family protein